MSRGQAWRVVRPSSERRRVRDWGAILMDVMRFEV